MKQKMAYLAIGMIFTLILSFTWISFADQSSERQPLEVEGNLTFIDTDHDNITLFDGTKKWDFTLDATTEIYRNGEKTNLSALKFTDEVKVLTNSEQQVRYVVATSTEREAPKPTAAQVRRDVSGQSVPTAQAIVSNAAPAEHQTGKEAEIREFEFKMKWKGNGEYKLKFKNKNGKLEAEIEQKAKHQKKEVKGEAAKKAVQSLLNKLAVSPEMSDQEIAARVLDILGLDQAKYKEWNMEMKFANGKKVTIQSKDDHSNKEDKADDDDDDDDEVEDK